MGDGLNIVMGYETPLFNTSLVLGEVFLEDAFEHGNLGKQRGLEGKQKSGYKVLLVSTASLPLL